jgi:ribosomal protein L35
MLKVEDYPNLVRDPKSKAIINVNRNAMVEHVSKQQMKESIQNLNQEMVSLKNDFKEIKALLQQIACKG